MATQQQQPRSTTRSGRTVARAATVSTGALVLCMAAAAPALANTVPSPLPVVGSGTPISVPGVPGGQDPIGDTVKQVTTLLGVPDPLATGSATGKTTKPKTPHRHRQTTATSSAPATTSAPRHTRHVAARTAATPATSTTFVSPAGVPGLRRLPPAYEEINGSVSAPSVAPTAHQHSTPIQLATQAQHFVSALARDGVPASRLVAMILSTMIIGVLAGAHIRQMQTNVVNA